MLDHMIIFRAVMVPEVWDMQPRVPDTMARIVHPHRSMLAGSQDGTRFAAASEPSQIVLNGQRS